MIARTFFRIATLSIVSLIALQLTSFATNTAPSLTLHGDYLRLTLPSDKASAHHTQHELTISNVSTQNGLTLPDIPDEASTFISNIKKESHSFTLTLQHPITSIRPFLTESGRGWDIFTKKAPKKSQTASRIATPPHPLTAPLPLPYFKPTIAKKPLIPAFTQATGLQSVNAVHTASPERSVAEQEEIATVSNSPNKGNILYLPTAGTASSVDSLPEDGSQKPLKSAKETKLKKTTYTPTPPAALRTSWEKALSLSTTRITLPYRAEDSKAAIFTRGNYLWIVFGNAEPIHLSDIIAQSNGLISEGERLPNPQFTIARFRLNKAVGTLISKDEKSWHINFIEETSTPKVDTAIDYGASQLHGSRISLRYQEDTTPLRITDPFIGDMMVVIPLAQEGAGLEKERYFTDYSLLSSPQGLVASMHSDGVMLDRSAKGMTLIGPTNRLASNAQERLKELQEREKRARLEAEKKRQKDHELTLLKFKSWGVDTSKENYTKKIIDLEKDIIEADHTTLPSKQLALARFYFTQSLFVETLGILQVIESQNEKFGKSNNVQFLKGAALFQMGRYRDAVKIFEGLNMQRFAFFEKKEVEFWLAAARFKAKSLNKLDPLIDRNAPAVETSAPQVKEEADNGRIELTRLMLETSDRLLKIIRRVDPEFANSEEVQTLESTARFVANHYQEKINRFEETQLIQEVDEDAVNDDSIRWGTFNNPISFDSNVTNTALNFTENLRGFFQFYPDQIFNDLALIALEERLFKGDIISADEILRGFKDEHREHVKNSMTFYKGLFFAKDEQDEKAIEAWESLLKAWDDRYNRARALYTLTVFHLDKQRITLRAAIENLTDVRYLWRGDILEINSLRLLGDMYIKEKRYIEGFKAWRALLSAFPSSQFSILVAQRMSREFANLFSSDSLDSLSEIDALTLFYEFSELTPIGRVGDDMIARLVDRLINLDLLERASAILTHQVRFRLTGEARDLASTKLALIHFMNQEPRLTIDVLNATSREGIKPAIAKEQRYLKVKSLTELARYNEALGLLKNDEEQQAYFLRADIYWRQKVWSKVIEELRVPFRILRRADKKLSEEQVSQLLRLAVAYGIDDQHKRLEILFEDFIALLPKGKNRDVFSFIASSKGPISIDNLQETVDYESMNSFLQGYMQTISDVENINPLDALSENQ